MKKLLIVVIAAVVLGGGVLIGYRAIDEPLNNNGSGSEKGSGFGSSKKAAHFETSTPAHGQTLAAVPVDIAIDFNFDLADGSEILIQKDGQNHAVGNTIIDENSLTMRRQMQADAPDGTYAVNYKACWPDGSCHEGNFKFAIDSTQLETYQDMRGRKDVTINMTNIMFEPANLLINKGTRVTWVNEDDVTHFVNTDSHPAHTQVPEFNSRGLEKGEQYSYVFGESGAYSYHCSAHAATMTATVVVE